MKKNILVTQRLYENPDTHEVWDALDVRWSRFLAALDLHPVLVASHLDSSQYLDTPGLAGLLLTGGNDLSSINPNPLSKHRDALETSLLEGFLQLKLPVIAVCRGMQFVGHYFGSSLQTVTDHVRTRHKLVIHKEQPLAEWLQGLPDVNSYHNYALSSVPPEFQELARSTSGHIEAMWSGTHQILGLMWHPERENSIQMSDLSIFREVLNK